jgi:lysozyme family protein
MPSFTRAMVWLLSPNVEGGYANDSADRGGETKYGISRRTYPDLDIQALTEGAARDIYYRDFWRATRVCELPEPLDIAAFDSVVQHPPRVAIAMMQRALGVSDDGLIGPKTITAARIAVNRDGGAAVLIDVLAGRALYFARIAYDDDSQSKFLRGWFRRLFLLHAFLAPKPGEMS